MRKARKLCCLFLVTLLLALSLASCALSDTVDTLLDLSPREAINNLLDFDLGDFFDRLSEKEEPCPHITAKWVIREEPTCTAAGIRYRCCEACGAEIACESIPVDEKAHTWEKWVIDIPSTCTREGRRHRVCTGCEAFERDDAPLDPSTHVFSTTECTADEQYSYFRCTVGGCNAEQKVEHYMAFYTSDNGCVLHSYQPSGKRPTTVVIPKTYCGVPITEIDRSAFYFQSEITTLVIPDSVQSIGDDAFRYCRKLTSLTLPSGLVRIGNYAFAGCTSLVQIHLSSSVVTIGEYAFNGCTSLVAVHFDGTRAQWQAANRKCNWISPSLTSLVTVVCTDGSWREGSYGAT